MSSPFGDKRAGNAVLSQEQAMESILQVTAAKTLTVSERNIRVTGNVTAAFNVTLPAAYLCPGAIFYVYCTVVTNGCVLKDAAGNTVATLDTDEDCIAVMSVGDGWIAVYSDIS